MKTSQGRSKEAGPQSERLKGKPTTPRVWVRMGTQRKEEITMFLIHKDEVAVTGGKRNDMCRLQEG